MPRKQFTLTDSGASDLSAKASLQYYLPFAVLIAPVVYMPFGPWFVFWLIFAVLPVVELFSPDDVKNPTEDGRKAHEEDLAYKVPLYLVVPVYLAVLRAQFERVASGEVSGAVDLAGLAVGTSMCGALGLTVAHELLHKSSVVARGAAHLLLALTGYGHFFIEHQAGHHKTVATPEDHASAVRTDDVYTFAAASYSGSYRRAWEHERKRLGTAWSPRNSMLWFAAGPLVIFALVARQYGAGAAVFFAAQAALATFQLECINFLEHWALRREALPNGKGYEPVNVTHSWNAPNFVSNALLFKLQRHSDHHANAKRAYHVLRCFEESPQLPSGYTSMITLTLFPATWNWVMEPLVDRYLAAEDKRTVDYAPSRARMARFTCALSAVITVAFWGLLARV